MNIHQAEYDAGVAMMLREGREIAKGAIDDGIRDARIIHERVKAERVTREIGELIEANRARRMKEPEETDYDGYLGQALAAMCMALAAGDRPR